MDREQLDALESRIVDSRFESRITRLTEDPSIRSLLRALMRGDLAGGGILSRMPYSVTIH